MQTLMFTEFIVMILPGFHGFLCEIMSVWGGDSELVGVLVNDR